MPLPVNSVPGLAFICSMCVHMATAADKGFDACDEGGCGGPHLGLTFPKYKGPLESAKFTYCFRCGEIADQRMEVDSRGSLGICQSCSKKFLDMEDKVS